MKYLLRISVVVQSERKQLDEEFIHSFIIDTRLQFNLVRFSSQFSTDALQTSQTFISNQFNRLEWDQQTRWHVATLFTTTVGSGLVVVLISQQLFVIDIDNLCNFVSEMKCDCCRMSDALKAI
jgi:hypothetical protein